MKLKKLVAVLVTLGSITPVVAQDGVVEFDDLVISGERQSAEKKGFYTPGAVSVVGENKTMESLDSVVRALPGTYTNIDPTQGTLNVNIRGVSGFGRVNTMIDGVPQTFYGTSANSASRYHDDEGDGYGPSSQFGAMIDQNFLVGMEVSRGFSSGSKGINALAGYANLRTIGVDDVVQEGNTFGLLSKMSMGTNGLGRSGMLTLGVKHRFANHGSVGAIFGYSGSKITANYKDGNGNYYDQNDFARRLDQTPKSWLAKVEIKPDEKQSLTFSGTEYQNNVGGRTAKRRAYSLAYNLTPSSPWVDLTLLAATTQNTQTFDKDASVWQLEDAKTKNKSDYIDLSNTSRFSFKNGYALGITYGASYLGNRYQRTVSASTEDSLAYTPFSPSGKQELKSLYLSTELKKDIWTWNNNLTYTYGTVKGFKPACNSDYVVTNCFPKGASSINLKSKDLNFSSMLSVNMSDWFEPFVSYSRNTRVPNVQEVFFNNEGASSMNPFLKPERSSIWQLGFNTKKENIWKEGDFLGLKLVAYHSTIRDYIASQSFYLLDDGSFTPSMTDENIDFINPGFHAQIYTNALRPVRQKGIELNLNYDAGKFFTQLSYSYQKSKLPVDATSKTGVGFGTVAVTELPRHYANWTLGGRFLDEKLTIGTTLKYTGRAKRMIPSASTIEEQDTLQNLPKIPMLVDVFAHYQVNKNVLLKFSVQNLTNRHYVDTLNTLNSTLSQAGEEYVYSFNNSARGRTYLFGAEVRF